MLKTYKYRLSPTILQADLMDRHMGSCRFIYNLALETKRTAYSGTKISVRAFDLMMELPQLKNDLVWLKEINSQSLQQAIKHLDESFTWYFKGIANFPKFKKKSGKQAFTIPQALSISEGKLSIPKFREGIKIILHRPYEGIIKQATIKKTPTGKYFAYVLCDNGLDKPIKHLLCPSSIVGIDLGIKSFLVTSDAEVVDNPRFLKRSEKKLKYVQSRMHKYCGKKTKKRFSILHEKVANQRTDFLNKLSIKLIRENQSIAIEDLNIEGMIKNRRLSNSIGDVGWGAFVEMLKYKSEWYGVNLLQIGQFEPSSKTCSCCGTVNKNLSLQERVWTCRECGFLVERDVNAAINIKQFALNNLSVDRRLKNQNELPIVLGATTSEVN